MTKSSFFFLYAICAVSVLYSQKLPSDRQNVVMIIADDLNDWIEPYGGHPQTKTPNILRLANQGMTFTNVWPTVSWCNPSRVSLITGIHPLQSGVLSNDHFPFRDYLQHANTLMDSFKGAGYYTIGFGKILHKSSDDEAEGWDEYYPYNIHPIPDDIPAHGVEEIIDLKNETYDWAPLSKSRTEWGDHKSVTHAIDFLKSDQAQRQPFFMSIGLRLPHLPFYYPEEFDDFLEGLSVKIPMDSITEKMNPQRSFDLMRKNGVWTEAVKSYLACINFVDYNIGRFLDELGANKKLDDNTIIILISDHGYHIGEKQRWGKVTLWNEALRTPCIVRFPHMLEKAGQKISTPISLLDIYPTLSEFLELEDNPWLAGNNFLELIDKESAGLANFSVLPDLRFAYTDNGFKYINSHREMIFAADDFNELDFESALSNQDLLTYYREKAKRVFDEEYLPFEMSVPVKGVEFEMGKNGILMNWDQVDNRESYEVRVCQGAGRKEYCEDFVVDTTSIELDEFYKLKIRSINPKYASSWSNSFSFQEIISEWPLEEVFALNPITSIYDFSGRRIIARSKFSYVDFTRTLKEQKGSFFIVRFEFGDQSINRKVLLATHQ